MAARCTALVFGFVGLFFHSSISFSFDSPVWGTAEIEGFNYAGPNYSRPDGAIAQSQGTLLSSLYDYASKGQNVLGYFKARQLLLGRIYLQQDRGEYLIRDVYCLRFYSRSDFGKKNGLGPDQIPDTNVLNTEHTWPQSRFTMRFPEEMQKSDLHHLFPADTEMNTKRGNLKFAELAKVGNTIPIKCNTSRLANTPIGFRFEPPMEHRGNVARALFYFSVRYRIPIDNDEEVFLRRWHVQDPVDQAEAYHHEMIFKLQGNRNPFVDRPDLVNQVADF